MQEMDVDLPTIMVEVPDDAENPEQLAAEIAEDVVESDAVSIVQDSSIEPRS